MRPAAGGFGFTVTGGYPKRVLVHKVLDDYPASGILMPGDQLLRVNDTDLSSLTHEKVLEVLTTLPNSQTAVFTILRDVDCSVILMSISSTYAS
jgi:type II secretory pathway component PulC